MSSSTPITKHTISDHPARFPRLYRLKRGLTITGLAMIGAALVGELLLVALGVTFGGGTMLLLMLFTAALGVPLIIGSILTPPLAVSASGILLHPMLGPPHHVPWEAIQAMPPYTLLPVDDPIQRWLVGRARMPRRDGRWIVVSGGLPTTFRFAAWIAGLGNVAVFAISDASHQDYDGLIATLEAHTNLAPAAKLAE